MNKAVAIAFSAARIGVIAIVVSVIATLITELAPGSPGERAARALGVMPADDSAVPAALRAELVQRVADANDLSDPLPQRLARQTAGLLRGDLGRSWRTGEPVARALLGPATTTLALILAGLAVAFVVGIGLAAAARLTESRLRRSSIRAAVAIALITPPVWIALLLVDASGGRAGPLLAIVTLATVPAALVARHAALALAIDGASDHARTARARGVPEHRLVLVHGAREVGAKLAALVPGLVGYSLGAAMVIETVFGIRGFGAAFAEASARGDAPIIVGAVTVCATAVACSSALATACERWCDPRLAEDKP